MTFICVAISLSPLGGSIYPLFGAPQLISMANSVAVCLPLLWKPESTIHIHIHNVANTQACEVQKSLFELKNIYFFFLFGHVFYFIQHTGLTDFTI